MTPIASPARRPRKFKKLKLVITRPEPHKIEITGRLILLHKATDKNVRRGMFLFRRMPLYEIWEMKCGTVCLRSSYTEICSTNSVATADFFAGMPILLAYLEYNKEADHQALFQLLTAKLQETTNESEQRSTDLRNRLLRPTRAGADPFDPQQIDILSPKQEAGTVTAGPSQEGSSLEGMAS